MVMAHFNNKLTVDAIPKVSVTATKVLDSAALRGYPQWRVRHVNME
jgi:hypothetical protein